MYTRLTKSACICLFTLATATTSIADSVKIVDATVTCADETCRIDVTLRHQDSGWDHYADYWRIIDPDGNELGKRVLAHPHVNEQPFTRSLSGVRIPSSVNEVVIEAHDTVHGLSGETLTAPVSRN